MSTCQLCGAAFFSGEAWGGSACGDCIADRAELLLTAGLRGLPRKPMKRADGSRGGQNQMPDDRLPAEKRTANAR
jgi:hypothetical protein